MLISPTDLDRAVHQQIITSQQAKALWDLWNSQHSNSFVNLRIFTLLYYLGALFVLLAMGWLADIGREQLGTFGLTWVTLFYMLLLGSVGAKLWQHPLYRTGGGVLLTLTVCLVPLLLYSIFKGMGWWPQAPDFSETASTLPDVRHFYYVVLELALIFSALVMLYFFRFPFLMAPLMSGIWFLTLDSLPILLISPDLDFNIYSQVAIGVGSVLLFIAFSLDYYALRDFASWSYLVGLALVWSGFTSLAINGSEITKAAYGLFNIFLLFLAALLNRKIFFVFGGLGLFSYLSYLAYSVFNDIIFFPLILSLLGMAFIYLGFLYQRHASQLQQWRSELQDYMQKWLVK